MVSVPDVTYTYSGSAQTPGTVRVTGAGGVVLFEGAADHTNNTNAGPATASYTFGGDANHTGSSNSKNFTIGQATATVAVTDGGSCGGGCACGESDGPDLPVLDARSVPHAIRHATIFGALDAVKPR